MSIEGVSSEREFIRGQGRQPVPQEVGEPQRELLVEELRGLRHEIRELSQQTENLRRAVEEAAYQIQHELTSLRSRT